MYKNLGKKRIIISPLPVAAAAPAVLSAYAPAPAIGESPTRLKRKITCNKYIFKI